MCFTVLPNSQRQVQRCCLSACVKVSALRPHIVSLVVQYFHPMIFSSEDVVQFDTQWGAVLLII